MLRVVLMPVACYLVFVLCGGSLVLLVFCALFVGCRFVCGLCWLVSGVSVVCCMMCLRSASVVCLFLSAAFLFNV